MKPVKSLGRVDEYKRWFTGRKCASYNDSQTRSLGKAEGNCKHSSTRQFAGYLKQKQVDETILEIDAEKVSPIAELRRKEIKPFKGTN